MSTKTGFGRVCEGPDANGVREWRILAWTGTESTPAYTSADLGNAADAGDRATYATACGVAHTSGKASWESHMAATYAGWSAWYGAQPGAEQASLYEAARLAGQHGLTP